MEFEIVTFSNYKEAIKIQNEIFPNEDGSLNILASLDPTFFKEKTNILHNDANQTYYIVKINNIPIGITGIYDCHDKDEAWLAWFGVLPPFRRRGYGQVILKKTILIAKESGYKNIRLYTDRINNDKAINLYKKLGFIGEKYLTEVLDYDCWIYSMSLTEEKTSLLGNKNLQLSYQSDFEKVDKKVLKKIFDIYDKDFKKS